MEKPKQDFSMALIDGDIIGYRCSVSAQDEPSEVCKQRIDDLMSYCLDQTVGFALEGNYKVYLTGKDNFRYDIAKSFPYKGHRKDKERPEHLTEAREYLVKEWGASVVDGAEADDALATDLVNYGDEAVIVSIDKDFSTVPGWKYWFVKNEWQYDTEWTALKFFYTQVLTGDSVDNIKGLFRVGPVKAGKILEGASTEEELFEKCLAAYDGDLERVVENARLLHLRRFSGEMWEPPK